MKSILAVAALACSFNVMAARPSQSMDQFCADRANPDFVKSLTSDYSNLMGFTNQGGMINGGVCWWHSRFQRSALYLTVYKPHEAKPSKEAIAKIISKIRSGKSIVEVPGYKNFYEFSADNSVAVLAELEKWQKEDGIVKFSWVNGLSGSNEVSSDDLKRMMDELYQYVEVDGNIGYQKLQIKGIVAHAWLVVHMVKMGNGYQLEIIDSNFPSKTNFYNYEEGQTSFYNYAYGRFTPYLERKAEMNNLTMTVLKKCDPAEYKARKAKEAAERNAEDDTSTN